MSALAEWDSFCVIVGSSAGGLIGLQFVVMTLIADRPRLGSPEAGAAFATPTIVHFSTVLFLAAALRAPWNAILPVAVVSGLLGVSGVVYAGIVTRRMRSQTTYRPQFEDWSFHVMLPAIAYATLAISALAAPMHTREALFGVGAATLVLLFIGIHNAWDAVTYVTVRSKHVDSRSSSES